MLSVSVSSKCSSIVERHTFGGQQENTKTEGAFGVAAGLADQLAYSRRAYDDLTLDIAVFESYRTQSVKRLDELEPVHRDLKAFELAMVANKMVYSRKDLLVLVDRVLSLTAAFQLISGLFGEYAQKVEDRCQRYETAYPSLKNDLKGLSEKASEVRKDFDVHVRAPFLNDYPKMVSALQGYRDK